MKNIFALLFSIMAFTVMGQSGKSYHVSAQKLNLRTEPNTDSEVIEKLKKYDNLVYQENASEGWVKVTFEGKEGYVFEQYISKGKAVEKISSYRVGARCKDGTSSSATGRGACSHHGGVSSWKYKEEKRIDIVYD